MSIIPLAELYEMDNVILFPHLTFYTQEAMARLTEDTLVRCREILEGRPVLIKSHDPRLRAQRQGVCSGVKRVRLSLIRRAGKGAYVPCPPQ